MTESEIHQLIQQTISGNHQAFERLYHYIRDDVHQTVTLLLINKDDIQDVINEVYLNVWRSLSTYDPNRPFHYWLHGVVVRQVQDWRRKIWRRLRLLDRERSLKLERHALIDDQVLQNESSREVIDAIRKLSYKLRCVMILRYFHEYSFPQIAELLQLPVDTVKSRHFLALKQLRKIYSIQPKGKEGIDYVIRRSH